MVGKVDVLFVARLSMFTTHKAPFVVEKSLKSTDILHLEQEA